MVRSHIICFIQNIASNKKLFKISREIGRFFMLCQNLVEDSAYFLKEMYYNKG